MDGIKAINATLIKVNSEKGKGNIKVEPEERPETAWQRITLEVRLDKHRALAARLIREDSSSER